MHISCLPVSSSILGHIPERHTLKNPNPFSFLNVRGCAAHTYKTKDEIVASKIFIFAILNRLEDKRIPKWMLGNFPKFYLGLNSS
jgi:hypothetical protein